MYYVLITALGIALCSFFGALTGFLFENIPTRLEDSLSGCAAGIMLCSAVLGLIVPSVEFSGGSSLWLPTVGIFFGALFLSAMGRSAPRFSEKLGMKNDASSGATRTLLFVAAIAIHHFPEGIAAGVSFGTGDISDTVTVAGGIAFQNIPESMIIIPPLLKAGTGKMRAAVVAVISALAEILGVLMGFFAISVSAAILPFALSFAAGTMLFVVADDMLPQPHMRNNGRLSTYMFLSGFCLMLIVDNLFA